MSASQPLMALLNTDLRPTARSDSARAAPSAGESGEFAGLLAEQLPPELESAIGQLSAEQRAALEQAALAADGKSLPQQVQDWLEQLPLEGEAAEPGDSDALAVIGQWMQLLQDATQPGAPQAQAQPVTVPGATTTASVPVLGQPKLMAGDGVEPIDTISANGQGGREQSDRQLKGHEQMLDLDLNRPSRQTTQAQTTTQQDFSAALQRAAGNAADAQPLPAATLGKLAEQLERGSLSRGGETDGIEVARPGSYNAAAAALTPRPVAAPAQSMGVPFGQPSWGEAMVEKVMWMSSQNLRSVEIQLDPAELGPLEIHIQQRGQELQVQFVSQNPSVREALEAQMHRLRDMFGQQGLEQAEVTVADRSAGEQPGQRDGQPTERTGGRGQGGEALLTGSNSETSEQAESRVQWTPTQRLVDYYA